MITYVTVGTIQVILDHNGKPSEVLVAPTSEFTVKFDKDSYIVLLPLDSADKTRVDKTIEAKFLDAKFGKLENLRFSVSGHSESVLTQVAIKRTVVEIQVEFETDSVTKVESVNVISLKIPAAK